MKKWLMGSIILGAVGLTVLSGCGNSDTSKKDSAKSDGGSEKIVWYQVGDEPKDFDKVMKKVNEITKKELNVELDMRLIADGDYQQKMGVIINSGEEFDICFTNSTDYVNFANKGAFLDLNDHLDKELKDYSKELDKGFITGGSIDGKLYALPVNNALATTEYWTINKKMVDDNNIDVSKVKDLASLEPVMKEFTEKAKDKSVTPLGITQTSAYLPYDFIMGSDVPLAVPFEGDTTKIVNVYETDKLQNDLKLMHKYYQNGYILKDAATVTTNPFKIENDNWLIVRNSSGEETTTQKSLSTLAGKELIVKPLGTAYKTTGFSRVAMHAISAGSNKQEKALELLNYINTHKEIADLLVYGIEGEHYDRNEDGSITMTNTEDYYQGAWALLNCYLVSGTSPVTEDSKKSEQISRDFQKNAPDSPILGFAFDSTKFRTEIASIKSVMDQYVVSLNTGTVDPEKYIPELLEKLDKAGLPKVQEEAQKQYTEWLKTMGK